MAATINAAAAPAADPRSLLYHHYGEQTQQQHQAHHQPYPPLPASPTLTNPDMILPDYDDRAPSLDLDLGSGSAAAQRNPAMWTSAHAAMSTAELQQLFAKNAAHQQPQDQSTTHIGYAFSPAGALTPTTPIIYGNGTMLSDIGEVTEGESTVGVPSPVRARPAPKKQPSPPRDSASDATRGSSPTMGHDAGGPTKKRANQAERERRASFESTSTITTQERQNLFADFDDSVSVGDSVFQGDDEESVAESYIESAPLRQETARLAVPSADNVDRSSTYSTSSISRRAEMILANAKKRLTTMEGNLTRARGSLHIASPSISSIGSDSTPSPPFQSIYSAQKSPGSDPTSPAYTPSHTRGSSDISARTANPYRPITQRSASALGVSGGSRPTLPGSRSASQISVVRYSQSGDEQGQVSTWTPTREHALAPLNENEVAAPEESSTLGSEKTDPLRSPTFGYFSDGNAADPNRGLTRSASAAQMRDLKDQMQDLKGKISSLREQARADSMKRRSLQSLRTPSPFTHAQVDQWYAEPRTSRLSSEVGGANQPAEPAERSPWNGEVSSMDDNDEQPNPSGPPEKLFPEDDEFVYDEFENSTKLLSPGANHILEREIFQETIPAVDVDEELQEDRSDVVTENGDYQDAVTGGPENRAYESESGESMYHDTVQNPISHEDREDAFDYEHFFLHSAMGTIAAQRAARGAKAEGYASDESVETTRGPIVEKRVKDKRASKDAAGIPIATRPRRPSDASISTIDTFATANEAAVASQDDLAQQNGVVPGKKRRSRSPEGASRNSLSDNESKPRAITRHSTGSMISVHAAIPEEEEGKDSEASSSTQSFTTYPATASRTRRPFSGSADNSLHRPSVSSFESIGTNRSFPLVNPTKKAAAGSGGILTPSSSASGSSASPSPDHELRAVSASLLSETASICEARQRRGDGGGRPGSRSSVAGTPKTLQTLVREDQRRVEQLMASLGRCVLGLQESGAGGGVDEFRRRIVAARAILEGQRDVPGIL